MIESPFSSTGRISEAAKGWHPKRLLKFAFPQTGVGCGRQRQLMTRDDESLVALCQAYSSSLEVIMAAFIVTYDLLTQGQNYQCIIQKLKSYETHWHIQGSVWIIESNNSAVQIRDYLKPCLDQNDKLLVARLEGEAAWYGYSDTGAKWLKSRLEKI